jgi:hypothetical protein
MIKFNISCSPTFQDVIGAVKRVETEVLNDLTDFFDKYARKVVVQEIATIFATEGRGTWANLTPAYAEWKRRAYPGKTILRRTNMYFQASTRKGAKGNLYVATKDSMTWGVEPAVFEAATGAPYPTFMEEGVPSVKKRNNKGTFSIPARPVYYLLEISQILQNNLVVALKTHLERNIRRVLKEG